ncbi:MAG: biotin--[acetyl-CoA-carboxylase] ligase [Actinomycetota bacterium]
MTSDLSSRIRGAFGRSLRHVATTGSTNSDALGWAAEGADEGAVVVADHQTGGRGRWGRDWTSAPGDSLLFSVILRPHPTPPDRLGLLSVLGGVATAEAVGEETGLDARVKWPNDVVIDGRKLAGVLAEARTQGGEVSVAVLGIGLNLSLPGDLAPEVAGCATSLDRHLPPDHELRAALLGTILERIERWYAGLSADGGVSLVRRAEELSSMIGRDVSLRFSDGRTLEALATGLSPAGGLRVEADGRSRVVDVAEVTRVRPR